eukprot:1209036-Pyramimonas_sp.AAC.1
MQPLATPIAHGWRQRNADPGRAQGWPPGDQETIAVQGRETRDENGHWSGGRECKENSRRPR